MYREEGRLGLIEMMMRRMKKKRQGKRRTGNNRNVNLWRNGRVVELVENLERLVAGVALHLGNIRSNFHGDIGDGVDGGVRRVGQRGIGVRSWFIVEGGNCCRVEHCARDRSRDNRGAKRGNGQKAKDSEGSISGGRASERVPQLL